MLFADSKLLLLEFLDTGTGTAVTFFFTRNTDLFFAVPFFAGRNLFGGDGDRRVLTFPSGLWLLGFDLNLFVGFGDGLGVGFAFPICRWEDAEGDGDASLKVQVCDFCWRERTFSYNLPKLERKTRRILWLLFLETKVGDLKRIGRWRAKAFSRSFRSESSVSSTVRWMAIIGERDEKRDLTERNWAFEDGGGIGRLCLSVLLPRLRPVDPSCCSVQAVSRPELSLCPLPKETPSGGRVDCPTWLPSDVSLPVVVFTCQGCLLSLLFTYIRNKYRSSSRTPCCRRPHHTIR